jgi:hypothetical protein
VTWQGWLGEYLGLDFVAEFPERRLLYQD